MTREDAIRECNEHIDHALAEVDHCLWKLEDLGGGDLVRRLETIQKKLVRMANDLYLFS